jgi:hypothetical protein
MLPQNQLDAVRAVLASGHAEMCDAPGLKCDCGHEALREAFKDALLEAAQNHIDRLPLEDGDIRTRDFEI